MRIVEPGPEVVAPVAESPVDTEDEKHINGWLVKWRDWVYFSNQDAKIGVWMAYPDPLVGWGLYSAYPGTCGPIYPGSVFNCAVQGWQVLPTTMSTKADLRYFKEQALEKLEALIWKVGKPPYDPYAESREESA